MSVYKCLYRRLVALLRIVPRSGRQPTRYRDLDETSNSVVYAARAAYASAVNDPEPDSRAVAITVMAGADVMYGGLQIAESAFKPAT